MQSALRKEQEVVEELQRAHAHQLAERQASWEDKQTRLTLRAGTQRLRGALQAHLRTTSSGLLRVWRLRVVQGQQAAAAAALAHAQEEQATQHKAAVKQLQA